MTCYVQKLGCEDIAQLCKSAKNPGIVHIKQVSFMVGKLYLKHNLLKNEEVKYMTALNEV